MIPISSYFPHLNYHFKSITPLGFVYWPSMPKTGCEIGLEKNLIRQELKYRFYLKYPMCQLANSYTIFFFFFWKGNFFSLGQLKIALNSLKNFQNWLVLSSSCFCHSKVPPPGFCYFFCIVLILPKINCGLRITKWITNQDSNKSPSGLNVLPMNTDQFYHHSRLKEINLWLDFLDYEHW